MMQHKAITEIFYDPEDDVYGHDMLRLKDVELDDCYRIMGEIMDLLDEVYEAIGDKRNEASRTVIKS